MFIILLRFEYYDKEVNQSVTLTEYSKTDSQIYLCNTDVLGQEIRTAEETPDARMGQLVP